MVLFKSVVVFRVVSIYCWNFTNKLSTNVCIESLVVYWHKTTRFACNTWIWLCFFNEFLCCCFFINFDNRWVYLFDSIGGADGSVGVNVIFSIWSFFSTFLKLVFDFTGLSAISIASILLSMARTLEIIIFSINGIYLRLFTEINA